MAPKARTAMEAPPVPAGKGGKGRGKAGGKKGGATTGTDTAKRIAEMDGRSIEAESNIEILRAQRAAARRGVQSSRDSVRETEGIDEEDPLISIDDGIRIEPFNMRREMAEGHFDEGGFYVLNKDEEKVVTDAWLDTVDKADKMASFRKEEAKKKAGQKAASRITAISKHLKEGGDDEEDKEEGEEKDEEEEAKDTEGTAAEAEAKDGKPEEEEEAEDEVPMLEELIQTLLPLETPTEALARFYRAASAKGKDQSGLPALKTRSAIKRARAGGAAVQQAPPKTGAAEKQPRRRLNEWGDYDSAAAAPAKAVAEKPAEKTEPTADGAADGKASAAAAEGGAVEGVTADVSNSTVTNAAAVAAAAAAAEVQEKAVAEAAAAFAAEMRMTKSVLHLNADGSGGPEAVAMLNLNSDDAKDARAVAKEVAATAEADDKEEAQVVEPGAKRRKTADAADPEVAERRKKVERLTDLCDSLLQKGINVYDSTRELLAIEVRERKGEKLIADEDADPEKKAEAKSDEKAQEKAADAGAAAESTVLFDNRRCSSVTGPSAVVDAEAFEAGPAAEQTLLWQFRWVATPDQLHGPFDSVTMHGWMTQGCFAEERPAEIRQCDSNNEPQERCWHKWDEVNFELYL